MKKILLDTNAYVALMEGDEKVLDAVAAAETVYLSSVVAGELFAGFYGGNRVAQNKRQLDSFLSRSHVALLQVGMETADIFGSVKQQLKTIGMPIPLNDVWIAAHAVETGSVLVSYDGHFRCVAGVRLWDEMSG